MLENRNHQKAFELRQQADSLTIKEWKEHVLTRALKAQLQGDIEETLRQWSSGSFTTETADGTAQLNAKALGGLHTIEEVLNHIEDLTVKEEEVDDDNPSWAQDPS